MADRDRRALGEPIELGRLAGKAAPPLGFDEAQRHQALEVVEGD